MIKAKEKEKGNPNPRGRAPTPFASLHHQEARPTQREEQKLPLHR